MKRIVMAISIILLPASGIIANSQVITNNGVKSLPIPLRFTKNLGQFDYQSLFMAKAGGVAFYFSDNEDKSAESSDPDLLDFQQAQVNRESMIIKAQFIGANANVEIVGIDRLSSRSNYFYGNDPSKWRTNVPEYSGII